MQNPLRRSWPHLLVGLLMLVFAVACLYRVNSVLHDPVRAARLVSADTQHYLAIARTLSQGDFSMSYVLERAHRQPLYPLLLAPVIALAGENLFLLASVSVVISTLAIGVAYLLLSRCFGHRPTALLVATILAANQFLIDYSTRRLLTEPLHILLMLGVIYGFIQYLRVREDRWLVLTLVSAGLDYVARPNGLFVAVSALGVVGLADLLRLRRQETEPRLVAVRKLARRYALAVGLFVLVTIPSWLPRTTYHGSPLYHGYLPNFMWADTYEEAHRAENFPRYSLRTYAATHTLGDVAERWAIGFTRVFTSGPVSQEHTPVLYTLAVVGSLLALVVGPVELRYLFLFYMIQMLPLIWTNLSHPTPRVPYAATLPFEVIYAGCSLAWAVEQAKRRRQGRTVA